MSNDRSTPAKPGTQKPAEAKVRPEVAEFLETCGIGASGAAI